MTEVVKKVFKKELSLGFELRSNGFTSSALGLWTMQYVEHEAVYFVQMETEGEKGSGGTQTIGQTATGEEALETMATPLLAPGTTTMDLLLEIATSEGGGGSLIFHCRDA